MHRIRLFFVFFCNLLVTTSSLTTVTASLSRDSPNTKIWSCSFTCISWKTESTATGSTAAIREPNSKQWSRETSPRELWARRHTPYRDRPMPNTFHKVPSTAYLEIYTQSAALEGTEMLIIITFVVMDHIQTWENISIQVMFLVTWGMLVQHFTPLLAAKCCNMFTSESLTLSVVSGARKIILNFGMENINLASEWKPELEKRKHWHWNKKSCTGRETSFGLVKISFNPAPLWWTYGSHCCMWGVRLCLNRSQCSSNTCGILNNFMRMMQRGVVEECRSWVCFWLVAFIRVKNVWV